VCAVVVDERKKKENEASPSLQEKVAPKLNTYVVDMNPQLVLP